MVSVYKVLFLYESVLILGLNKLRNFVIPLIFEEFVSCCEDPLWEWQLGNMCGGETVLLHISECCNVSVSTLT
jgi:hypothetical protein